MARRKRSTRFAGSPAEHDTLAEKMFYQAKDSHLDALAAAEEGNCGTALTDLQIASKLLGKAEAHFEEGVRHSAATLNAQKKAFDAVATTARSFKRMCKLSDRAK